MAEPLPPSDVLGEGPPLVAVAGLDGSPEDWSPVPLGRRFQALRVAPPAAAAGAGIGADPVAAAAAIAPLVDAEFGGEPALLVGHGFGALVALALAARAPALAVVAIEQPLDPDGLRARAERDGRGWAAAAGDDAALEDAVDALLAPAASLPVLAIRGVDPGDGQSLWLRHRLRAAEVEFWPGGGDAPHLAEPATFVRRLVHLREALVR